MLKNDLYYVVIDASNADGLDIVHINDFMEQGGVREIVKPGTLAVCQEYRDQYSPVKPYIPVDKVRQEEINKARANAGRDLGNVDRGDKFPLIPNDTLTPEEKMEILNRSFEEAGFVIHAALIYCNETRNIEATVKAKTGEKYLLTFKKAV